MKTIITLDLENNKELVINKNDSQSIKIDIITKKSKSIKKSKDDVVVKKDNKVTLIIKEDDLVDLVSAFKVITDSSHLEDKLDKLF